MTFVVHRKANLPGRPPINKYLVEERFRYQPARTVKQASLTSRGVGPERNVREPEMAMLGPAWVKPAEVPLRLRRLTPADDTRLKMFDEQIAALIRTRKQFVQEAWGRGDVVSFDEFLDIVTQGTES